MSRSWLALLIVVLVIAGVVGYRIATRPKAAQPAKEPVETVKPEPSAPTTKQVTTAVPPKPGTATPEQPRPEAPLDLDKALKSADEQAAAGKGADAMKTLSDALAREPKPADAEKIKARLVKLGDGLLFSSKPSSFSVTHTVAAGDRLWNIARKHKTTIELIKRINGLKDDTLRVGQTLKIIPGGFDAQVSKGKFLLTVTKGGLWIREFKVGLGKDGSTPIGDYVAGHKIPEPPYTATYPHIPFGDKKNNPLGTRWITIRTGGAEQYGLHGTWEPESIGKEESKGCVRMRNEDVEWVYDLLVPGESKISIKP